jgi:hypothetical protein
MTWGTQSNLRGLFDEAVSRSVPDLHAFRGTRADVQPNAWVCADASGRPVLLIPHLPSVVNPLRLRNLEITYSVRCVISDNDSVVEDVFAVIACLSDEEAIADLFWGACEALLALLPPAPTAIEISQLAGGLTDLFAQLSRRPSGPMLGLIGELLVILASKDPDSTVRAWRNSDLDTWDFVFDSLRVDAKLTTSSKRQHELSYSQANPADPPTAHFASILLFESAVGVSVSELMAMVLKSLSIDAGLYSKVQHVVAETLGPDLASTKVRVDISPSIDSIRIYSASDVPAVRAQLERGVTGVRFTSDFEAVSNWRPIAALGI